MSKASKKSYEEMYIEAAHVTSGQYKGYTGANALSLYVYNKYDVNAAESNLASDALHEAMPILSQYQY